MCGIAGLTSRNPRAEALTAMLEVMRHRGPDDEGERWVEGGEGWHAGLGSRRLAILDLSHAGHQPMVSGNGTLVYNGEVYNFTALQSGLRAQGVCFESGTDTEVVLHMLRRNALPALGRLNGMFALAYWDDSTQQLLLARDRFGIKPLYYRLASDGSISFASEMKCFLASGMAFELEAEQLGAYLSFGYVPGDSTLVSGVHKVPAGHALIWKQGDLNFHRFADVEVSPHAEWDEREATIQLREALRDSVRRQLVADVPVGILLSGGLDSSSVLGLAASFSHDPVRAYTIGFREEDTITEQNADDARYARLVADHYGADLTEFEITPDIVRLLPQVAWHLDEPLGDPAAVLSLIISQTAAQECTVLLSGQGADELFGGYRVQQYDRVARILQQLPSSAKQLLTSMVERLPALARRGLGRPGTTLAAHRALSMILQNLESPAEQRYVSFRSAYHFDEDLLRDILHRDLHAAVLRNDPRSHHLETLRAARAESFFDRLQYLELKTFLKDQNLLYSDRASMAASIELRVPFLDDAVADIALSLPAHLKVRWGRGKYVLRRAVEGIVPQEVVWRRKAGFGAPIRRWLRTDLRETVQEALVDGRLAEDGIIIAPAVAKLMERHASGEVDHTYRLWTLFGLEMWWRSFLNHGAHGDPAPKTVRQGAPNPPAERRREPDNNLGSDRSRNKEN